MVKDMELLRNGSFDKKKKEKKEMISGTTKMMWYLYIKKNLHMFWLDNNK